MKLKSLFSLRKWVGFYLGTGLGKQLPDKQFIELEYYAYIGKCLNLRKPITYNEKIQWLKLYDRNPLYTQMVDKVSAKKYVANIVGPQYVIPTYGVWDEPEDINFEMLPEQFVLKVTHDSGGVIVCKNKKKFDCKKAIEKLNRSLQRDYYMVHREWPYKDIKPRIIAEQYMEDVVDQELRDYKLMCFNGKVKCSFVCSDRFSDKGLHVTFFDRDWNRMPFERHYPISNEDIAKPQNYEEMISVAEKLTTGIPFARVDLYEIKGKVYFGEITFYPGSGYEEFTPVEWDYQLGAWIDLSFFGEKNGIDLK